jgi:predicted aldo/keto reductase-like oxidoreductase
MYNIILGDNQFFGVSHMSEEKGMNRAGRFQDINAIIEILDAAYDAGIHAFSFSTHDRVQQLCDHFRANPAKYSDIRLYPVLPYAQKYAHLVNEKGIIGTINEILISNNTAGQIASMIARGGAVMLKQDPVQIMKLLVDVEMKMFRNLNIEVVFLQNNITDLLLGFGIKEVFSEFALYIEQKYRARAGFMTLNMPRLVDFLLECGMENPVVGFAMNKVGFQMNPDIACYEQSLRTKPFQALAMSIMAAGAVPPKEAIEYVASFKNIKAILFGASTKAHVTQTKKLIEELF